MGYNEGIGKVWLSTHDAVGQIVAAKTCGRLINLAVGIRHTKNWDFLNLAKQCKIVVQLVAPRFISSSGTYKIRLFYQVTVIQR